MDYKELVTRIDEMQMSARDKAAAKAQLAHAERIVDWAAAAAGGLRKSFRMITDTSVNPAITKLRGLFHGTEAA